MSDPEVIIKIDVSNAFNSTDRPFTLDCISGRASCDYACGLKRGDVIGTVDSLTNLFGYFKAIRSLSEGWTAGGPLRDSNIQSDYPSFMG